MKYIIDDSILKGVADSVRAKTGSTDGIKVEDLPEAVASIPSGGSEPYLIHTFTVPSKTKTYTFNYTPSGTSYILIIRPKEDFSFQSDYACALQVYAIGNNSGYSWLLSHSSHKIGTGGFTATVSGGTIKLTDNYANYFPGVEYNVYLIPVA